MISSERNNFCAYQVLLRFKTKPQLVELLPTEFQCNHWVKLRGGGGGTWNNFGWGYVLDLHKPDPGLILIPCSKLANQDPFKSVYIKKQLNGTMASVAVCLFQEKVKEMALISK